MLLLLSIFLSENSLSNINKLAEKKKSYLNAVRNLSSELSSIIDQSVSEIPSLIESFRNQPSCFILGKHIGEWISKEGSLKIKEISYIHAEGFSAAALKHGPFALLSKGVPVIFLVNNDRFYSKLANATAEVKSRGATVIHITNKPLATDVDHTFYYKTDSVLFPVLSIVPLQVLSYYLTLDRGYHPDYPRNLAKVVTVE